MNLLVLILEMAVTEIFLEATNEVAHARLFSHHFHLYGGFSTLHEGDCCLAVKTESPRVEALGLTERGLILVHHRSS